MIRGCALCVVSSMLATYAFAADFTLPRDGWVSWQVPAVEDAPDWCCRDWRDGKSTPKPCQLDTGRDGYGSRDGAKTDSMRVYARFERGKVERLRALSASCPVQTNTSIQDRGTVSTDASAHWLAGLVQQSDGDARSRDLVVRDALAALAVHRGDVARDALTGIARNNARTTNRKEAVFWLAHLRGVEGAAIATSIMFGDEDAEVREHAAFAVSQSKSPQAAADLIRLANTDADPGVRGNAWLWLARTESTATEDAIDSALRKESDDAVRRQAIFALSQLPDVRATRALITVLEDQSRLSEDRKQAVFWLSQSKSAAAQTYLERLLTAAGPATRRQATAR